LRSKELKMKKLKSVLIILLCMVVLAVIGCRSLMDELTPIKIDERAMEYAGVEKESLGFISLADAEYLRTEIIIKHRDGQLNLKRIAQDDKIKYQDALGFIDANIDEARVLQGILVGNEDNPYSLLGLLAPMGIAGLVGRQYFRRPGDYTPEEVEVAINKAKLES